MKIMSLNKIISKESQFVSIMKKLLKGNSTLFTTTLFKNFLNFGDFGFLAI